jgi:hypothetical protein
MLGEQAQYAIAHGMKSAGPEQARHHAAIARLAAFRQHSPTMVWVRRIISWAARRVKVSMRMRAGSTPFSTRCAARCASVLVLPVPAPGQDQQGTGPASSSVPNALVRIEQFE